MTIVQKSITFGTKVNLGADFPQPPDLSPVRQAVLEIIGANTTGIGPNEVFRSLPKGMSTPGSIKTMLPQMVKEGLLEKAGRGAYTLVNDIHDSPKKPAAQIKETRSDNLTTQVVPSGHLVRIDSVAVTASAGDGDDYDLEVIDGAIYLDESVARDLFGAPADRVKRLTVTGTSMYPTLHPGQRIYVVLMQPGEEPADGAIYLLRGPHGLLVKRLRFESTGDRDAPTYQVRIQSDNPDYETSVYPLTVFHRDFHVIAHVRRAETAL